MPHKLSKISARSSKRFGVQVRKTHGGVASTPPPLTGRGLSKDPVVGTPAATRQSEDSFDHQIDVGICKRAEILTGHSMYFYLVT